MTIRVGDQEVVLRAMDSCSIPGGETREAKNNGNQVATMLVVMPYPESRS
jgi:quercetin dioxygenase-like cupin family protein